MEYISSAQLLIRISPESPPEKNKNAPFSFCIAHVLIAIIFTRNHLTGTTLAMLALKNAPKHTRASFGNMDYICIHLASALCISNVVTRADKRSLWLDLATKIAIAFQNLEKNMLQTSKLSHRLDLFVWGIIEFCYVDPKPKCCIAGQLTVEW